MIVLHNRASNALRLSPLLLSMIVGLVVLCTGCGSSTNPSSHVSYDNTAGHILVRLFDVPGFIYPPFNGVPEWTLYGDGTLIFKTQDVHPSLSKAQLSVSEVQHILDVLVNQNAFLASSQASYGQPVADTGTTLLSITANGQSKEVRLLGNPTGIQDSETMHVFASRDFLLAYHPTNVQKYTSTGVALVVILQTQATKNVVAWPYNDISLAQIVDHECTLLQVGTAPCTSTNSQVGLVPVYGQRGLALLTQSSTSAYTVFSQNGKSYQVIVWPLLLDALLPQANGTKSVAVEGNGGGAWPLLSGFGQPS